MSQKRRLEEYHDPDYPQEVETKKTKTFDLSDAERQQRIVDIVKTEFRRELVDRRQELISIDNRICQLKDLLQKVRYAVTAKYYANKELEFTEEELRNQSEQASTSTHPAVEPTPPRVVQNSVHPSLKKLLGKHPIDYDEILKVRPTRQAAKVAMTTISEKLRSKKDEMKWRRSQKKNTSSVSANVGCGDGSALQMNETEMRSVKVPQYIEPSPSDHKPSKGNSARGRNQTRHLIAVGNTSVYIGDENSPDMVTHKWMVYVRTLSGTHINDIVSKVRFFLHPSYKPNDVVEVKSPFQLSRRGWGEFPIRLQLYFHPHTQQKPLQIYHNLVLDKKMTGEQMMGAETLVEVYLSSSGNELQKYDSEDSTDDDMTNDAPVDNIFEMYQFENERLPENGLVKNENVSNGGMHHAIIKEEYVFDNSPESMERFDTTTKTQSAVPSKMNETLVKMSIKVEPGEIDDDDLPDPARHCSLDPRRAIAKNGEIFLVDPNRVRLRQQKINRSKQESLLKPQVSLLKPIKPIYSDETLKELLKCIRNDHDYAQKYPTFTNGDMGSSLLSNHETVEKLFLVANDKSVFPNRKAGAKLNAPGVDYMKMLTERFLQTPFDTTREAIVYLLKRTPLVTKMAVHNDYKCKFPFAVEGHEQFDNLLLPKQRSYEWGRAKLVQNILKTYGNFSTPIWTTKEIILFARRFGYTPMFNVQTPSSSNNLKEIVEHEINRSNVTSSTLTLNQEVHNWIQECRKNNAINFTENEIIDVDEIEIEGDNSQHSAKCRHKHISVEALRNDGDTLLSIEKSLTKEAVWVTDICNELQFKLQPEQIVPGVWYPAAQRLMVQALHCFVEELIRNAFASRPRRNFDDLENIVREEDIKCTIQEKPNFDFLTNKHLGVLKIKDDINHLK